MTPKEPPYPVAGNGAYVPMTIYLEDRRELREWMRSISKDVHLLRGEMKFDAGSEAVREEVSIGRREKVWAILLIVLSSSLGAFATAMIQTL